MPSLLEKCCSENWMDHIGEWEIRENMMGEVLKIDIVTPAGFISLPISKNLGPMGSWQWNQSIIAPSLWPSIKVEGPGGGWHGHLEQGQLI